MRRVTLADVARAAGVAKATASRALSADHPEVGAATRVRIQEIATELGYQPSRVAQALSTGRVRLIEVFASASEPGWAEVLAGAVAEADRHGYHVMVRPAGPDGSPAPRDPSGLPVDGVLLVGPVRTAPDGALPLVAVDEETAPSEATVVRTANWSAGLEAGRHLIARGRTSAAVVMSRGGAGGARARAAGFRAAFAEARLEFPPDRVLQVDAGTDAQAALDAVLERRFVNGLFAAGDESTVAALGALGRTGLRVPEDVEVVCFGDERIARLGGTALTAIPRPASELGARAVQLLVRTIEGPTEAPQVHELPVRLLPGTSADGSSDGSDAADTAAGAGT
jgi:LacI family transcriptional regulator